MKKILNKANILGAVVSGDGLRYKRRPDLLVGDVANGYNKGDLMDANAVAQLITDATQEHDDDVNSLRNTLTDYIDQKVEAVIGGAPEVLDTLKEISEALNDDPELIKTTSSMLNTKALIAPEKPVVIKIELLDYLFSDGSIGKEIGDKTPVAICVAPASHFEDGCARFMSLKEMALRSTEGTTNRTPTIWNTNSTDIGLTKFATVAVVDGEGNIKGVNGYGFIPAKRAAWSVNRAITAATLNDVYYGNGDPNNPSAYPFLEDGSLNPNYAATMLNGLTIKNMFADVNGVENTASLVGLVDAYAAANVCHNFTPGTHNGEWYLPAMGELGYIIALFDDINAKIAAAGSDNGVQLDSNYGYWSSTEYNQDNACCLNVMNGFVGPNYKTSNNFVRAFLKINPSTNTVSQVQIDSNLFDIQDARVAGLISELSSTISELSSTNETIQSLTQTVTQTIEDNEEVTAAALNDLNDRVSSIEEPIRGKKLMYFGSVFNSDTEFIENEVFGGLTPLDVNIADDQYIAYCRKNANVVSMILTSINGYMLLMFMEDGSAFDLLTGGAVGISHNDQFNKYELDFV